MLWLMRYEVGLIPTTVWHQTVWSLPPWQLKHGPLVDLIHVSLRGLCHTCGECHRLPWSGVTLVPGQDGNRSGAAWRHRAGWLAGCDSFTPSAASVYLLPQLYYVVHGTSDWHFGRGPNRSSCPTQRVLRVLPSQLWESLRTARDSKLTSSWFLGRLFSIKCTSS